MSERYRLKAGMTAGFTTILRKALQKKVDTWLVTIHYDTLKKTLLKKIELALSPRA